MNASEVIDRLGGTAKVAEMCDVQPPSVSEWRKNGIPKARQQFLRLLKPEAFGLVDSASDKPEPIGQVA